MKLKKIRFQNNKILGNLELDFTDNSGKVADTIILAGENGCGKTSLLDFIYEVSGLYLYEQKSNEIRTYNYLLEEMEVNIIKSIFPNFYNEIELCYDFSKSSVNNYITISKYKYNTKTASGNIQWLEDNVSKIIGNPKIKEIFGSIYSTVEINYNSSSIASITSKELDENIFKQNKFSEKSDSKIGTEIKQLFVDIQSNDAIDLLQWVNEHPNEIPPEKVKNIRMSRFKEAFNFMFDNTKYNSVKTVDNHKEVYFQKGEKIIPIDQLSSGEKQIVFRGGFLLKNIQVHKGHIVLIDEPEISLHPNWQKQILGYYKKLFTDNNGQQMSQLFIATHSPFILDSNYRYNDKAIILKNNNNKIEIAHNSEFYSSGEISEIKQAFNVDYFNDLKKTYILTEGETDEKYIREYFKLKGIVNYNVQWVGKNVNNNVVNTGYKALENFKNFMLANPNIIKSNIVLLYDCDTNKSNFQEEKLKEVCIPKNSENDLYKKGIENLLTLPETFKKEDFYIYNTKIDEYGAVTQIQQLNKMKLCDYVCSLSTEEKELFLNKFNQIVDLVCK